MNSAEAIRVGSNPTLVSYLFDFFFALVLSSYYFSYIGFFLLPPHALCLFGLHFCDREGDMPCIVSCVSNAHASEITIVPLTVLKPVHVL